MFIYTHPDQLPSSQEEYFSFYHARAVSPGPIRPTDMPAVLEELRLAYQKYENKHRIESIAAVIKSATLKHPMTENDLIIQQSLL